LKEDYKAGKKRTMFLDWLLKNGDVNIVYDLSKILAKGRMNE